MSEKPQSIREKLSVLNKLAHQMPLLSLTNCMLPFLQLAALAIRALPTPNQGEILSNRSDL